MANSENWNFKKSLHEHARKIVTLHLLPKLPKGAKVEKEKPDKQTN